MGQRAAFLFILVKCFFCCSILTELAVSEQVLHAVGLAAEGEGRGSYLELFDLELDGLDVSAELQALELLQFLLRFPQPGPDVVQVRLELLPFLEVLLHPQLLAQCLGL